MKIFIERYNNGTRIGNMYGSTHTDSPKVGKPLIFAPNERQKIVFERSSFMLDLEDKGSYYAAQIVSGSICDKTQKQKITIAWGAISCFIDGKEVWEKPLYAGVREDYPEACAKFADRVTDWEKLQTKEGLQAKEEEQAKILAVCDQLLEGEASLNDVLALGKTSVVPSEYGADGWHEVKTEYFKIKVSEDLLTVHQDCPNVFDGDLKVLQRQGKVL